MISRRDFLGQSVLAATVIGTAKLCGSSLPANSAKAKPDVVIYDGSYPGWPWITKGENGTLYCVFREGTIHDYSADGKALICTSTDSGRSWSQAAVIVAEPDVDDRNVAITELPNTELLVVYNTYSAAKESSAVLVRSSDGGRTWSKPQAVGVENTRTRAAVKALSSGRLLLPFYVAPGNGALAAHSDDNGQTWKTVKVPDVDGFVGDEWDLLEVEEGRLIGIFRNNKPNEDGTFWMSSSRDGGESWSKPRPTNVQDNRSRSPAQITMHNEAPTIMYADRRMVSVSAVTTTDPDSVRWDVDNRHPCYLYNADESPIRDSSYPVSVQINQNERLIVDYEIRTDSQRITGYFVEFPENWGKK